MKKLTSLVAMLIMISTSAIAQSANPVPSNPSPSIPDTWQGVTASYNRGFLSCDIAGAKGIELNGFSIGYMKEFYILKSLPLFVETGLSIMYASSDEAWENLESPFESALDDWFADDYDKEIKTEYTYIGITLPVNLAYKFKLKDDFQLVPFAGVYMRGGVISNARCKNAGESKTYDLFNSRHAKRMGLRGAWERFQFGWQIGAKLACGPFTLGICYNADMNEIAKKTKMRNLSFSAGYNFFY